MREREAERSAKLDGERDMAKCFNVSQRERRTAIASRKRFLHGDPVTGKLKNRQQPLSVSGKRQRKLLKKWRREQKEAVEKGLLTLEDVEMAAAATDEGASKEAGKTGKKFHLKKNVKIKANRKQKGKKNKHKSAPNTSSSDAMVE